MSHPYCRLRGHPELSLPSSDRKQGSCPRVDRDELQFSPDSIEVEAGETVTFAVTNTGNLPHDFVIGDEEAQDEHEADMPEMTARAMTHDEPNAISIPAGETNTLTWRFTEPGELLYGCHEPGHYESGMVGQLTVE